MDKALLLNYEVIMFRFLKVWLGFGSLEDICWFSRKYWDKHDYHKSKGGDGTPSHFYEYTCTNCGKKFFI